MVDKITISIDDLRAILEDAYRSGWYGSLDMQEHAVEQILTETKRKFLISPTQATLSGTVTTGTSSFMTSYISTGNNFNTSDG